MQFINSGSWTGSGHGTDGWYVGDFNGDGKDDIFRYVPGLSGAQVFLSNGTQFINSGSWIGAGHGAVGWHVGNFDGAGGEDIFRYLMCVSGADVFLASCAAGVLSTESRIALDEDMMLDTTGMQDSELSDYEELELIEPFIERVMKGEEVSIFEIKKAYEDAVGKVVRVIKIRQLMHRHSYWDLAEQYGRINQDRE
jgi:hypothetical protein